MNKLFLQAMASGYSHDSCGKTMTVGELVSFLEDFDDDAEIYLSFDSGYTYGAVKENLFFQEEEGEGE